MRHCIQEGLFMRRWAALALGVAVLALGGLGVIREHHATPVARAADLWNVVVGGDMDAGTVVINSFQPSMLTIRAGDTVSFSFTPGTPHTVSLLAGIPRPALVGPGPAMGELALGPAFFPIPEGPGWTEATFDGRQPLSTGVPESPDPTTFRITFSATGIFPYACLTHPGMNGTVEVLAADAPLVETPAQAQARGQAEAAALLAQARADMQSVQSATGPAGTATVHTNAAGISSLAGPGNAGGASSLMFLPRDLTVRRGDTVVWMVADPLEIHTVTFALGVPQPAFLDVRPGPAGAMGPPLIVIPANVAGPAGGPRFTGNGYFNSGIVGPGNAYALTIDAPAGTYEYLCVIHAGPNGTGMRARLMVTE
jgi:plastocyanin